jgi:L-alanine-DL-glutamate epimerase-like enolase superfamily enzyme
MAFAVREAVGPNYPIAFDAFNGWTEPYAIEICASWNQSTRCGSKK